MRHIPANSGPVGFIYIGSIFEIVTQSRENGWRQIQYGLKFTF